LTKENDKVEDDFCLELLENNDDDERKVRDTKETKTELTIPNSKIRKELFPPTKEKFSLSDSLEKLMEGKLCVMLFCVLKLVDMKQVIDMKTCG
jgi:hypothetical protein